ncbi:helix-turn-helix domain-containing protein [Burkholderia cepacia]|uniref:helix-turn-helix domain-containing protein n=1 Tax=Burkholderia cepacia TaxID=292 RepID=UPI003EE1C198
MEAAMLENETKTPDAADEMFALTRASFREALNRALRVSDEADDGSPKRMTQVELVKRTRVARSTLAKYLADGPDDGDPINPDLKMLCRLAEALNVPPAYLLMRPEDWKRLAHAAAHLGKLAKAQAMPATTGRRATHYASAAEQSVAGYQAAKAMGVAPSNLHIDVTNEADAELARDVEERQARTRRGIRTTCALPPLNHLTEEYHLSLLYLCANVGANSQ